MRDGSGHHPAEKPFAFRGRFFLPLVIAVYGVLFLTRPATARAALLKSGTILLKIIPILMVIILFTAAINYFLQPRRIVRHLGRESGMKAWVLSLFAGLISHGPMYIWFPLLEELRNHGMRDALIVVFFAARTIKIPLLPMMVDYFGWRFTLILSIYILVGAIIQGYLLEIFQQRR